MRRLESMGNLQSQSFILCTVRQSVEGFPESKLVPQSSPITQTDLETLVDIISRSRRTTVLTGAGVSTASGIPDYRGPGGAYTRVGYQPMSHQTFMATEKARSRYWARNFAGWEKFKDTMPNTCHLEIAELQRRKWIDFIITQNVDRLHHKAGATDVIELHGTTHHVICTECGNLTDREELQTALVQLNPTAKQIKHIDPSRFHAEMQRALHKTQKDGVSVRPDGDVELSGAEKGFQVPTCSHCDGVLKPHVVFFGDSVPRERADMAHDVCSESEALIIIGSSVAVYSAYRLVRTAKENGAQIAIINVGETRADDLCDVKIECVAGEVLAQLVLHPSLVTPRLRQNEHFNSIHHSPQHLL